jgi:hypothetical protein
VNLLISLRWSARYGTNSSSEPPWDVPALPGQKLIAYNHDIVNVLQAEEEAIHDRTVALLAGAKFAYPSEEHPDWTTHVNVPERTMGIQHGSELIYPDLFVSSSRMEIARVVEVVSKMIVSVDDVNRWKACSSLSDAFYLFIPIETRAKLLQVLSFHRIPCRGLGLYAYDSRDQLLIKID